MAYKTIEWPDELCTIIRACFTYDPITGIVSRKVKMGRGAVGPITSRRPDGTMQVNVSYGGKVHCLLLHRLAFYLHTGLQPYEVVNKDGNKSNNKADNLIAFMDAKGKHSITRTRFKDNLERLAPGVNVITKDFSRELEDVINPPPSVSAKPITMTDDEAKLAYLRKHGYNWKWMMMKAKNVTASAMIERLEQMRAHLYPQELAKLEEDRLAMERGEDPFIYHNDDGTDSEAGKALLSETENQAKQDEKNPDAN